MYTLVRFGGKSTQSNSEFYGLSTDEKPTANVPNASIFYEMDSKSLFLFDEENQVWLQQ